MQHRLRHHLLSARIAEYLVLLLFINAFFVVSFASFCNDATLCYERAHPNVMSMGTPKLLCQQSMSIQDSVWRQIAHVDVRREKSASVDQLELSTQYVFEIRKDSLVINHVRRYQVVDTKVLAARFKVATRAIIDSLIKINHATKERQCFFMITVDPDARLQEVVTFLDELIMCRRSTCISRRCFASFVGIPYTNNIELLFQDIVLVHEENSLSVRTENSSANSIYSTNSPRGVCGRFYHHETPNIGEIGLVKLYLDYINPYGERILWTRRWWLGGDTL